MSLSTLPRLAEALQVAQEWLTTGRGEPPVPTGEVPPFPRQLPAMPEPEGETSSDAQGPGTGSESARQLAVAWARACMPPLSEEAIRRVMAAPLRAYTAEEWLAAIRLEAADLRIAEKSRLSRLR